MTPTELAKRIEHTILKPESSEVDIKTLCMEATTFGFRAVCIPPCWVEYARGLFTHPSTKIVSVISFPHGNLPTRLKAFEAKELLRCGADELDMVMNLGFLKSNQYQKVLSDISVVVESAKTVNKNSVIKVIVETALLSETEIKTACKLAEQGGADFVKTSTGFSDRGAEVKNIKIMKQSVSPHIKIKAAGGIKNLNSALAMLEAGADVIGCSSSTKIMKEALAATA